MEGVRRLIISGDIATGQVKSWHIPDYQVEDRHIKTGGLRATMSN